MRTSGGVSKTQVITEKKGQTSTSVGGPVAPAVSSVKKLATIGGNLVNVVGLKDLSGDGKFDRWMNFKLRT